MGRFLQLGLYTFFVAVSLLGLSIARPVDLAMEVPQGTILSHPGSSGLELDAEAELQRASELDARIRACREDLHVREEVVRALVDQRLSLAEAGERFRQLNATKPEFDERLFRREFPGHSDEERACWQVIRFAENGDWLSPPIKQRLTAEVKRFAQPHRPAARPS
jgi:hypothetical protein